MKLATFNLLQKMMELTFSESDGEALNAIRAANKILTAEGIKWDAVFKRLVHVGTEIEAAPDDEPNKDDLTETFDLVLNNCQPGTFRDFILDLQSKYERTGRLTPNQRQALMNAKYRATRPAGRR